MVENSFLINSFVFISDFIDVQLSDVYKLVREKVENERPDLANKITTTLGFVLNL